MPTGPVSNRLSLGADTTILIAAQAPPVVRRAAQYLARQAKNRAGLEWHHSNSGDAAGATIAIELNDAGIEEFSIDVDPDARSVRIAAQAASVLMGAVGQFARGLDFAMESVVAEPMSIRDRPSYPIRGQIIANHKQNNTCDLWGWDKWEEHITELAAWGNNLAIMFSVDVTHWHACLPFADPPWFDCPERKYEWDRQLELQLRLPALCHELGMRFGIYMSPNDIWPQEVIHDPSLAKNHFAWACASEPKARERITSLRRQLFGLFPSIDILFIPTRDEGGCPGCELCDPWAPLFIDLVEEQSALIREFHPHCKIWVSQQGMPAGETKQLLEWLQSSNTHNVEAMVYGPFSEAMLYSDPNGAGSELSMERSPRDGIWSGGPALLRRHLPGPIELVMFPDEIHTYRSQYPVTDMDPVVQFVWNREDAPAPRIIDTVSQFRATVPISSGAAPYSEGDTDDVNKMAWSLLLWNSRATSDEIARAYASWFWGVDVAEDGAWLILAIERAFHTAVLGDDENEARWHRLLSAETKRPDLADDWRWQSIRISVEMLDHIGIVCRRDRQIAANLRYRVAEWMDKADQAPGLERTIAYLRGVFSVDAARVFAITATRQRLFDLHRMRVRGVVRIQNSYMGFDRTLARFEEVLAQMRAGELPTWKERHGAIREALAESEDSHRMASSGVQLVPYLQEYPWETGPTVWYSA